MWERMALDPLRSTDDATTRDGEVHSLRPELQQVVDAAKSIQNIIQEIKK
jgi:hypothetical protein